MIAAADPDLERINAALGKWRQGDVVRGPNLFFVHVADLASPATAAAAEAARASDEALELAEITTDVAGLVVVTQTCDIVQPCERQPFVELAPFVRPLDEGDHRMIRLGMRPRYAVVPAVDAEGLVDELDRTMTVEKPILVGWPRMPGCRTDEERRDFARALARKRLRPAFPDEFVRGMSALQDRIRAKRGKRSAKGEMIDALREIRVSAAPSWDADQVTLVFWFIRHGIDAFEPEVWARQMQSWLRLLHLPRHLVLDEPGYHIRKLEDMSAHEYVHSD